MPRPTKPVPCVLCAGPTDKERDYCSGCNSNVCETCCDNVDSPWGSHEPQDHATAERQVEADRERRKRLAAAPKGDTT